MVCKMKNCFKLTFAILVLLLLCVGCDMGGNSEKMQPESNTEEKQKEERNVLIDNGYLSINYTTSDDSVASGRMMNMYTYDLATGELTNRAKIPYDSGYALGVTDLSKNKVYYSKMVGRDVRQVDRLHEYNLETKKSICLEEENCAYNDIVPIDNKLLVTTVPVHAIGTAMFDLNSGQFTYLYNKILNEDGYEDFPYETQPIALNYNFKYGTFVNVSCKEKALYNLKVRSGKKSLKYHISLVDKDFNVKGDFVIEVKSLLKSDIQAAVQITDHTVMVVERFDVNEKKKGVESEYKYYMIDYEKQTCKEIESPFPNMKYVRSMITVDEGKSYYIKGDNWNGDSGLFYYDCVTNELNPILLDYYDYENDVDNHVVNFCLVEK